MAELFLLERALTRYCPTIHTYSGTSDPHVDSSIMVPKLLYWRTSRLCSSLISDAICATGSGRSTMMKYMEQNRESIMTNTHKGEEEDVKRSLSKMTMMIFCIWWQKFRTWCQLTIAQKSISQEISAINRLKDPVAGSMMNESEHPDLSWMELSHTFITCSHCWRRPIIRRVRYSPIYCVFTQKSDVRLHNQMIRCLSMPDPTKWLSSTRTFDVHLEDISLGTSWYWVSISMTTMRQIRFIF